MQKGIKVITGLPRCGKSTLLRQFCAWLTEQGMAAGQILYIDFANRHANEIRNGADLIHCIEERIVPDRKTVLILDEVQIIDRFDEAIDTLLADRNLDLYLAGSNARLLSALETRFPAAFCYHLRMLPFSFEEFMEQTALCADKAWPLYLHEGGLPHPACIARADYHNGILYTILAQDHTREKRIVNLTACRQVMQTLMEPPGQTLSYADLAHMLAESGYPVSRPSVQKYVKGLLLCR